MAAQIWIAYLCFHFVLIPGWFAWRYRRTPYALHWLPRNRYDLGESAYGLVVTGYTVALMHGTLPQPHWPAIALASVIAGSGLIVLAVVTLGDSWRIGQDQSDATCAYVTQGPYRFLHHPIYWGMMISAFGQMLLTDGDARGLTLLAGTLTYVLLQGRAESLRWAPAKLLCKPGAAAADVATSRYLNPSNLPKKVQ
jgi:protein-S-isoprenylcysteine O-methyltransferase Ste14